MTTTPWSSRSWTDYSAGRKPGAQADRFDAAAPAPPSAFDQAIQQLALAEASPNAAVELGPAAAGAGPGVAYLDSVTRAYAAGRSARLARLKELKRPEEKLPEDEQWVADLAEAYRQAWLAETLTRDANTATGNLEALESANAALGILATMTGAELALAKANIAKGRVYAWRGETLRATEALNTALAAASLLCNEEVIADVSYELGVAYRDQRRFEVALPLFRVSLRTLEKLGREAQVARARQGLALGLIGLAKMSPQRAPALLVEARTLARQAYDWGSAEIGGKTRDKFRAVIAARDLAEVALLSPQDAGDETAQVWLHRARQLAYGGDPRVDVSRSLYEQIFLPAFSGALQPQKQLLQATPHPLEFQDLRLVEIEAVLEPDVSLRDAGIRFEQIYLMWEQRRLPTYSVETLLQLAEVYRGVRNDETAGKEAKWRAVNGEARARYLAHERALAMNADLRSLPERGTTPCSLAFSLLVSCSASLACQSSP